MHHLFCTRPMDRARRRVISATRSVWRSVPCSEIKRPASPQACIVGQRDLDGRLLKLIKEGSVVYGNGGLGGKGSR